jgi:SSS family solute:Na+ symporter
MVLVVLMLVGGVIIPFCRQAVGMSAYEYFERRSGRGARVYAALAFFLAHFSKMSFVFYPMALTIHSVTGWSIDARVAASGGGDDPGHADWRHGGGDPDGRDPGVSVQGRGLRLPGFLRFLREGGPAAVFRAAAEPGKLSLGNPAFDFSKPTIPVAVLYGFFRYLQRQTADQTVVQRYLAKSDRGVPGGVALGRVPVWPPFMLIGTCTWFFYRITGEELRIPSPKRTRCSRTSSRTHLPPGVAGLFIAAVIGCGDDDAGERPERPGGGGGLLRRDPAGRGPWAAPAHGEDRSGSGGRVERGVRSDSGAHEGQRFAAVIRGVGDRFGKAGGAVSAGVPESRRANRAGAMAGTAASLTCTLWAVLTRGEKRGGPGAVHIFRGTS